jgi:hypothetical protein
MAWRTVGWLISTVDRVIGFIKGKSAIHLARVYGERKRNFVSQQGQMRVRVRRRESFAASAAAWPLAARAQQA